jgi:signal transduction histidine kinase
LEKLNASHETFIYAVSHDLKAPLANIESLVQLLMETSSELLTEEAANNQEQQKIADLLNQSVVSMRHILNDLAEITKIEGNYREKVETIRFMDLIQEVEWTLKDQIQTSQAHIQVDLQESEIGFSRKNLRSILYNFLSNALKYQSPDRIPIISIKTEKMEGQVFLSVQDNGVGITAEKKELLFNRFTRLKSNVEGTGIGLYLVKKIMENAGGTIAVESAPGVGSMFQVSFSMPA